MLKPILIGVAAAIASAAGTAIAQQLPPPPGPAGPMARVDRDGDGIITRQEWLAQAGERFDRMDTNGNGRLEAGEMPRRMRGGPDGGPPPPPKP